MVVGAVAGFVVGAAGSYAIAKITGANNDKPAENGGSAAAEAATLMMPGASALTAGDLLVSMESSSSLVSALLHQLWPQINKIAIKTVKESMEPMFAEKLPGPFKKMHIRTLDLGKQPIKLENFVVHPVIGDTLRIELEINWDSNCDILLAGLPANNTIGVKTIKLRSRLVIVCRPILDAAPVVSSAQVAFINQPYIDLDFTGLANVADWANIRPMVDKGIKDGLSGSLVLPNRTFVKIDPKCDFIKAYQRPLGVMRVKLVKGRDFPILKSRGGLVKDIPDMYVNLELGNTEHASSVIKDRTDPQWNETFDFVLADYGQVLDIHAFDKDLMMKDTDMGSIQIAAVELLKDAGKKEFTLVCQPPDGKKKKAASIGKVSLECEMLPFCNDIASIDAEPTPNTMRGMVLVFISKLAGLPVSKEEAASFVKVTIGDKEFQTSVVAYDAEAAAAAEELAKEDDGDASKAIEHSLLNPEFNAAFQVPILDSGPPPNGVTFELMNGKKSLGKHNIPEDIFLVMKDEAQNAAVNIGGATMYCGVQALGLEIKGGSKDDTPAPTSNVKNLEVDT